VKKLSQIVPLQTFKLQISQNKSGFFSKSPVFMCVNFDFRNATSNDWF